MHSIFGIVKKYMIFGNLRVNETEDLIFVGDVTVFGDLYSNIIFFRGYVSSIDIVKCNSE